MSGNFVGVIPSGADAAITRAGLEIIRSLDGAWDSRIALLGSPGPLTRIADSDGVRWQLARNPGLRSGSFRDRVEAARAELAPLRPTLVYAAAAACSPWVIAAKQLGSTVVLHVQEVQSELRELLRSGATCIDAAAAADIVMVQNAAALTGLRRSLGYVPDRVIETGGFFAFEAIQKCARDGFEAQWLYGRPYVGSARQSIAMWGAASARSGVDIFVELAQHLPDHDFLWIGPWPPEAEQALARRGLSARHIDNFYGTGDIGNPYPLLARCSLLALTARELENPFDILELAPAFKLPIVVFSAPFDGRIPFPQGLFVLYGAPAADRLAMFVSTLFAASGGVDGLLPADGSCTAADTVLAQLRQHLAGYGM